MKQKTKKKKKKHDCEERVFHSAQEIMDYFIPGYREKREEEDRIKKEREETERRRIVLYV